MQKITVSAPGKLMLMGEHAVVYDHPCLVTAVDQRMWATVEILKTPDFKLEAPDVNILNYKKSLNEIGKGDIPKGAQFVEIAVKNLYEKYKLTTGIKVTTKSEFSSLFGFGSSSASTVCIVKALSELFNLKLSNKEIFDLAYKTVLDIQGKGSGFDVAVAVYGGTLYFITGGRVIKQLSDYSSREAKPNREAIVLDFARTVNLPLIVGYSGVKADTVTLMNKVKEKFDNNQKRLDEIYSEIEIIVEKAKKVLVEKDWEILGSLMNSNQQYLVELEVSIPKLDEMIKSSLNVGAYGAKLSGAGGGDCMIALSPDEKRKGVENAIRQAGGEVIQVKTNAEGVRIEL